MQELPLVAKEACLPGTLQANCHPCQQQRAPHPLRLGGLCPGCALSLGGSGVLASTLPPLPSLLVSLSFLQIYFCSAPNIGT
jgi:hypothetical protein